jgi:hypothetical protein
MSQQYDLINRDPVIRTYTGKYVNPLDMNPDDIDIQDIAHALSMQCRFGGHTKSFYSVAQHSLACANLIGPMFAKDALLHDASEAYLMDIPTPIKANLTNYKAIEFQLMEKIAAKFGFAWPLHDEIKNVDSIMLRLEWEVLLVQRVSSHVLIIEGETPSSTKDRFLTQALICGIMS